LFKAIHPTGTLEHNLVLEQKVGRLDQKGEVPYLALEMERSLMVD